jgi:hypothetical protein
VNLIVRSVPSVSICLAINCRSLASHVSLSFKLALRVTTTLQEVRPCKVGLEVSELSRYRPRLQERFHGAVTRQLDTGAVASAHVARHRRGAGS